MIKEMIEIIFATTRLRRGEFWEKVHKIAQEKLHDMWGSSPQCPKCKRFTFEMFKEPTWDCLNPKSEQGHFKYSLACNDCGETSFWFDTGFMGVLAPIPKEVPRENSTKCKCGSTDNVLSALEGEWLLEPGAPTVRVKSEITCTQCGAKVAETSRDFSFPISGGHMGIGG